MLWLQKLLNPTVLVFENGSTHAAKGRIPTSILREISAVLNKHDVTRGIITIDGQSRYQFSPSIPQDAHQSLRNLIASA